MCCLPAVHGAPATQESDEKYTGLIWEANSVTGLAKACSALEAKGLKNIYMTRRGDMGRGIPGVGVSWVKSLVRQVQA